MKSMHGSRALALAVALLLVGGQATWGADKGKDTDGADTKPCRPGVIAGDEAEAIVPFEEGKAAPEPEPGYVWCLVSMPGKVKTVTERKQIQPETHYFEQTPAKYELKTVRVKVADKMKQAIYVPAKYKTETVEYTVEEESFRYEIMPAKYEWVEKEVVVREGQEKESLVAAKTKTETERILVAPERKTVHASENADGKIKAYCVQEKGGGETLNCYWATEEEKRYRTLKKVMVEKEATTKKEKVEPITKTIRVRKMVQEPEVKKVAIPAKTATYQKQVLVKPAHYRFEEIPAEYETVDKLVKVEDADKKKVTIPAKYVTVRKEVVEEDGKRVWCRTPIAQAGRLSHLEDRYGSMPAAPAE